MDGAEDGVVTFDADHEYVSDSGDGMIRVGFSNGQPADDEGHEYLLFDRSYRTDGRGGEVGEDDVYAERNGQGGGWCGGVERVELHSARLVVVRAKWAATRVHTGRFVIGLSGPPERHRELRRWLRVVFDGPPVLVECDAEPGAAADGGGR